MKRVKDRLDAIDQQILTRLQRYDSPRSKFEVASELGVSPATVRRRTKKLTDMGIVTVRAIVDPGKVGLPVSALVALTVD